MKLMQLDYEIKRSIVIQTELIKKNNMYIANFQTFMSFSKLDLETPNY